MRSVFVLFLKSSSIFANSADPDEMPLDAAFHKGLHCLPKSLLNEKRLGLVNNNPYKFIISGLFEKNKSTDNNKG